MASIKTARKPTTSTNTIYSISRYIKTEASIVKTSIQSMYDWKSDQFQKYFTSKSRKYTTLLMYILLMYTLQRHAEYLCKKYNNAINNHMTLIKYEKTPHNE